MTLIQCYIEARGDEKTPVGIVHGLENSFGQKKIGHCKYEYSDLELFKQVIEEFSIESCPRPEVIDRILAQRKPNPTIVPFDPELTMTKKTKALLYPLQLKAIQDIISIHDGRCPLEAPPGAGKTPIALAAMAHYDGSCMIICPASVASHWQDEALTWVGKKAVIVSGNKVKFDTIPKIVVVPFDTLRVNKQLQAKTSWNMVIVDESHLIKNPKAKKTIVALEALAKANHFILMSGTPMKKCPSELYCQLLPSLGTSVLGTFDCFAQRYCSAKYETVGFGPVWRRKKGKMQLVMGSPAFKQELNLLMDTTYVRVPVNMEEMLPVFKRYTEPIELSMDDLMEQNEIQAKLALSPSKEESDMLIMELWRLTCKQKAPHHSRLINESLQLNSEKGRLIVFNQLRATTDYIIEHLPIGTTYVRIDGRVSKKKRAILIKMLAHPKNKYGIDVGFLSVGTCALGINLTPRRTNCYMSDLPFSVQDIVQCENKLRRIGAKFPITSIWGVAEGSYDDNFMKSLKRKLNTCSEIVKGKKQLLDFDLVDQSEEEEEEDTKKRNKPDGPQGENKHQKTLEDFWVL